MAKRSLERTATRLGQLDKSQRGVVSRHRLERDVGVPLRVVLLLEADALLALGQAVQVLELGRGDGADLGVVAAQLAGVVQQGVDVERRRLGTPGQLAEAQDELLLEVVGEVVLGTEEDDAALRDCAAVGKKEFFNVSDWVFFSFLFLRACYSEGAWKLCLLVIARSLSSSSELGALSHSTRLALGNSRPMTGVESKDSYASRTPVVFRGSLCSMGSVEAALDLTGASTGVVSTADGAILKAGKYLWNCDCVLLSLRSC